MEVPLHRAADPADRAQLVGSERRLDPHHHARGGVRDSRSQGRGDANRERNRDTRSSEEIGEGRRPVRPGSVGDVHQQSLAFEIAEPP